MLRLAETSELLEILAVLIENLDTAIPPIRNVNPAVPIDVNRVYRIELAITFTRCSPLHEELPILVELHHPGVRVAIADKECSVGQPRNVGRPAKVFFVSARHSCFSKRHNEPLAVVRELEDLLPHVVDDPDVPFRIVWADFYFVRTAPALEQMIPLRPGLDHLAGCINDDDAVAHFRFRRQRRTDGAISAVEIIGQLFRQLDLTAIDQNDAVGTFRENTALRTQRVAGTGELLRPIRNDLVRTGLVFSAFLLGRRSSP